MCANPQINQLNTIAVRASYILPILRRFPWWKPRKTVGGGGLSPPEKNQNRNHFVFLGFWVNPLNWQSFTEIGEIACSRTAQCSRGHTLKLHGLSCTTDNTGTRSDNSWYHAKTKFNYCSITHFSNDLQKDDTSLWVCKSLRKLHGRGAWKPGRLWIWHDLLFLHHLNLKEIH